MKSDLRKRAEAFLSAHPEKMPQLSMDEIRKIFHELDVHQIELQMQNEELMRIVEELEASRDAYAELYDSAPVGYFTCNRKGLIVRANRTLADMIGIRHEGLKGRHLTDFITRDSQDAWYLHRRALEAGTGKMGVELEMQPEGRAVIHVRIDCTAHPADDRTEWSFRGVVVDITERWMAELELARLNRELDQRVQQRTAELLESEERFRTLFEESPDACFLIDPDGRYVDGNRETERQNGYSNKELIGQSVFESPIFPPVARETVRKRMDQLLRGEHLSPTVYDLIRKDGSSITVEVTSMLVQIAGKPMILCHSRDLTERNEAEVRYRRLFEVESHAILIFDGESRMFIDVNDAAVNLYGYTREEFMKLTQFAVTAEPEASEESTVEALDGVRSTIALRHHRKKDGTVFPVEIARSSFVWKGRTVVCGVVRDVSERMAREKALRHLASELSLAEQREQQRIASILHDDITQLLGSAHIRLQAIEKGELSEATRRSLEKTYEIIDQTIQHTRALTFELSCPMLNELGIAAALEELCRSMSKEHGIRFEFKNGNGLSMLQRDTQLVLYRSTRELMINVMKHAHATQAVVELERTDDSLRIRVWDDGKGFDNLQAGTGFAPSGGFGLFNIREYVRHIGGDLTIESIAGDGTRVEVTVPMENKHD